MYRLALLVAASVLLDTAQAASPGPPKLDIAGACRDTAAQHDAATRANAIKSCLESENKARKELEGKWSRFDAEARTTCLGSTAIGGVKPVYSELISCIEMKAHR
jgi:hypothetical protein